MTKWLSIVAVLFATAAAAQTPDPYTPLQPIPLGDTLLTLPTSHIPAEGTWEVKFTHRFNQSIDQGSFADRLHSLFGLDSNADVGFGLSYAPHRNVQFSMVRSNTNDAIETAAKWVVFQQSRALPFSAALRGGVVYLTERDLEDRASLFGQAIVSRQFGQRAEIFAMPSIATNAGRAINEAGLSAALFEYAVNVPVGVAVTLTPAVSVVVELTPPNGELPDNLEADIGWAVGLKRVIGGHWFELLLTNSSATFADQYLTSTFQGSPLDQGDLKIGFNIERRFGKRR